MKMDNLLFQPFWPGKDISFDRWNQVFGERKEDGERKSITQHLVDGKWVDGKSEPSYRGKSGKAICR